MRIFNKKNIINILAGIAIVAMPAVSNATQSKKNNDYGTFVDYKFLEKIKQKNMQNIIELNIFGIQDGGFSYSMGNDAAKSLDFSTAIRHWGLSSRANNFYANWQLARYYLGWFNNQRDDVKAINFLRIIIEENKLNSETVSEREISADAMVELAVIYIHGSKIANITPDIKQAIRLLEYASLSVGHAKANYLLGEIFYSDKYKMKQKRRGLRYYKLSALKNYFLSQIKLGEIRYVNGRNKQEKKQGLAWLLVAQKNQPLEIQKKIDNIILHSKIGKPTDEQLLEAKALAEKIYAKLN